MTNAQIRIVKQLLHPAMIAQTHSARMVTRMKICVCVATGPALNVGAPLVKLTFNAGITKKPRKRSHQMFNLYKQETSPRESLRRLYNAAVIHSGPIHRYVSSMHITIHLCINKPRIVLGISTPTDHDPPTIDQWDVVINLLPEMNMPPPQRHNDDKRNLLYSIRNYG